MSDDELAGEDEKGFFEHFAPVYRSLKRTVTSRSIQTYAVSVVGILVLSASVGGTVIGVYGLVQEDFGLCNNPIIEVTPPEGTADLAAGDAQPSLPHIDYEELTRDEQQGFRTALNVVNNEEEVEGNVTTFPCSVTVPSSNIAARSIMWRSVRSMNASTRVRSTSYSVSPE